MNMRMDEPGRRNDLLLALGLYLFCAVVYWQASLLPPPFFDPLGSAAVPKFASLVLVLLGTLVLARLFAPVPSSDPEAEAGAVDEATPPDEQPPRPAPWTALGSVLIPVAYVGLMATGLLGFREASILFVFAMGALLARFRRTAVLLLIPLAIAFGIFFDFIFTQVFYVDLPRTFAS